MTPERKTNWKVWRTIKAGGKSAQVLEGELERKGMNVSENARIMMQSEDFVTLTHSERFALIFLKLGDLNFTENPTTYQIYEKVKGIGLELCPPELLPELRLKYIGQPFGEFLFAGMKQIADSDGHPKVFSLSRREDGPCLSDAWAGSNSRWDRGNVFVFCLPQ
jgi:hypothetical protein